MQGGSCMNLKISDRQSTATRPSISVVIPTLNEARNLPHVFEALTNVINPEFDEVLVVDGHSVDDTVEIARQLWPTVRVVMQTRKGKGNALACGFGAATRDVIVMLDADGSADPAEIPLFLEKLVAGADFAKGTRFAGGGGSRDITRLRRIGNKGLNVLVNRVYRTSYTDLCYGYNAFWRHCLPALGLDHGPTDAELLVHSPEPSELRFWGDGFEIETLINIRLAIAQLTVHEVPSFEHFRIHGESNLRAFSDGMRVLRTIAVERRYRRRREMVRDAAKEASSRTRGRMIVVDLRDGELPARHEVVVFDGCAHSTVTCMECAA
jgi:glycosyltransferase involved in cell wall biosynthesis